MNLSTAGSTLLVVDDELVSRIVTAHILHRAGYKVMEASGVAAAADLCGHHRFAAVICDFAMEDGTGIELFALLREKGNPVPFILASGVEEGSLPGEGNLEGLADRLSKPIGSQELRDSVARVLATPRPEP